jgi:hypothetical protein
MIRFTPPGFGCSVIFGKNVIATAPGFVREQAGKQLPS